MRNVLPLLVAGAITACGSSTAAPTPPSAGGAPSSFGDLVAWTPQVVLASSECGRDAALVTTMRAVLDGCASPVGEAVRGVAILDVEDDGRVSGVEVRLSGSSCALFDGELECEGAFDEGDEEYGDATAEVEEVTASPLTRCLLEGLGTSQLTAGCREAAVVPFGVAPGPPSCDATSAPVQAGAFRGAPEPWLMVCDPSGPSRRWTTFDPFGIRTLEASPRGGYLAATRDDDRVTVIRMTDGRVLSVDAAATGGRRCFAPDETGFAVATDAGWRLVALDDFRVSTVAAPTDGDVVCGPGRLAAAATGRVVLHRFTDGAEVGAVPVDGVVEGLAFDGDGGLVIDIILPERDGEARRVVVPAAELP
jgi:hypothetical protein